MLFTLKTTERNLPKVGYKVGPVPNFSKSVPLFLSHRSPKNDICVWFLV